MTRLATTITIPVASAAKQENSTRSLKRKGMLNASPSPPLCTAHFDTPRLDLRSMPDSGAIKNYYACFPHSATVVVTLTGLTIRHRDLISPLAAWHRLPARLKKSGAESPTAHSQGTLSARR